LACVVLIYLWVNDEWNMDKFHVNNDRMYKVMQNFRLPQGVSTWEHTPILLAGALKEKMPDVESTLSICNEEAMPQGVISFNGKELRTKGLLAEEGFFDFFSFKLIQGDKNQVINVKNNVAISEELAKNIFGTTNDVIGKTVNWDTPFENAQFLVTGVFEAPPVNSIPKFDFVTNIDRLLEIDTNSAKWNGDYGQTFITLKSGTDINQFNEKLSAFMEPFGRPKETFSLFAQKFSEKYLHGNYENGEIAGGRIVYVRIFSIIALIILLIACVNFINLSTAQASLKMKEIGVKKTIGATRKILIFQLLGEAGLMTLIALVFAIQVVALLLPQFNEITGKNLHLTFDTRSVTVILLSVVFTGIIAGSYSAFYISGFNPVSILKGKLISAGNEKWLRNGLVVFQFSLSILFIIGVMVIGKQMEYIQRKNLGFNRENVLSFQRINFAEKPEEFIAELKRIPGVVNVSSMFGDILDGDNNQSGYSWKGDEADKDYLFKSPIVGFDIIECLGMNLLAGRTYSRDFSDEQNKIVINESARKLMGLENPVGKVIAYGQEQREIIGVVGDFNYGSMHHRIEPLMFRFTPFYGNNIMVKIKPGTEKNTLESIEKVYSAFHPAAYPFEPTFLDDDYQRQYAAENRVSILSQYFSGLAILISCLGLFGLAMFTIERKRKEIGIRKVLGASVSGIVSLLSKDFLKLVLIALAIASPLAYFFMNKWLQDFAYRIDIQWTVFALAGLVAVGVAFLTVSFQSVKAALANPVKSLRSE